MSTNPKDICDGQHSWDCNECSLIRFGRHLGRQIWETPTASDRSLAMTDCVRRHAIGTHGGHRLMLGSSIRWD